MKKSERHPSGLQRVTAFPEMRDQSQIATAVWTEAEQVGGCCGCGWRGRVAEILMGRTTMRLCAKCINNVNRCLGAIR